MPHKQVIGAKRGPAGTARAIVDAATRPRSETRFDTPGKRAGRGTALQAAEKSSLDNARADQAEQDARAAALVPTQVEPLGPVRVTPNVQAAYNAFLQNESRAGRTVTLEERKTVLRGLINTTHRQIRKGLI